MGELLCKSEKNFDPQYALLGMDADMDTKYREGGCTGVLRLRLKSPKEDKQNRSLIVDVFGNGGNLCPVRAMDQWGKHSKQEMDQPLFRIKGAKCLGYHYFWSGGDVPPDPESLPIPLGNLNQPQCYLSGHWVFVHSLSPLSPIPYSRPRITRT
jgi:hypothetical protein